MSNPIKILIADDHSIVRTGIKWVIDSIADFELAGEASSKAQVINEVARHEPDVLILDLWLGEDDGLQLLRELRISKPEVRVLVYSMSDEKLYGVRSIQAGARGFLMKDRGLEELAAAIRVIVAGHRYLSEQLAESLIDVSIAGKNAPLKRGNAALEILTDRELQILRLIGRGKRTGEIAQSLGVSPKTIGAHRENLKNKLGSSSSSKLLQQAVTYVEQHEI